MTDEQTPDDVREAVARAIRNVGIGPLGPNTIEIAQRGGDIYMTPDEAMRCADAAMSATRRPTVGAEQVWAIADGLRKRLSVSNGTQVWVEYQGSAEELADMIAEIVKERAAGVVTE